MDKYITISNKNQYITNKNGEFTADIVNLELNKKYKLGVSEFIYSNKNKINLGTFNLDIVTHTKSSNEYINHQNFMSQNNRKIKSLSRNHNSLESKEKTLILQTTTLMIGNQT
jgi:hypothetical protein